jgi:hypothetical protein
LHEDRLTQSQILERTIDKIKEIESEKLADRVLLDDLRETLRRWESRIPELIHGSVKECMEFETRRIDKKLDDHLNPENRNPHPRAKKPFIPALLTIASIAIILGVSVAYFINAVNDKDYQKKEITETRIDTQKAITENRADTQRAIDILTKEIQEIKARQ